MISLARSSTHGGSLGSLTVSLCDWLGRFPRPVLELMGRIGVAGVFWKSGLTKIDSWETTVALFREEYALPILAPETAAYLGTTAELICPILIAFGVGARLGAAALLAMTLVIQTFVYPGNWPEHLLWASVLAYVLTRGAGALSIDQLVARRWLGVEYRPS